MSFSLFLLIIIFYSDIVNIIIHTFWLSYSCSQTYWSLCLCSNPNIHHLKQYRIREYLITCFLIRCLIWCLDTFLLLYLLLFSGHSSPHPYTVHFYWTVCTSVCWCAHSKDLHLSKTVYAQDASLFLWIISPESTVVEVWWFKILVWPRRWCLSILREDHSCSDSWCWLSPHSPHGYSTTGHLYEWCTIDSHQVKLHKHHTIKDITALGCTDAKWKWWGSAVHRFRLCNNVTHCMRWFQ